ncbi:hypothetical protein [Rhizobium sp. BK399]|uniref:hypothetical protein n=1 Tax=Rhizobium sp. BK399 TaxID=2587063 RepID=UPI0016190EFA|nr:hypothetical protein [Rhizobium sp. BK399]
MAEIASSRSKRRVLVALAQVPSAVSKLGRMSKRELDDFGMAGSEIANIESLAEQPNSEVMSELQKARAQVAGVSLFSGVYFRICAERMSTLRRFAYYLCDRVGMIISTTHYTSSRSAALREGPTLLPWLFAMDSNNPPPSCCSTLSEEPAAPPPAAGFFAALWNNCHKIPMNADSIS